MDRAAQRDGFEEHNDGERQFLRAQAPLRIRHRVLTARESQALRIEIETASRHAASGLDPRLVAHLERLEAKLDRLLAVLEPVPTEPLRALERRDVEISGAGLRMNTNDRPPVGSEVLVELLLPGSSLPLRAIGGVCRHIDPIDPSGKPAMAVEFRVIHENDRQAIVRFALDAERCRLRARARGDWPTS